VDVPLELAINAPNETLRGLASLGWSVRDAFTVSRDLDVYRAYLSGVLGELSVAKSTYVRSRSGWFSDRTECFLALGRPAVVQDTGWTEHLPSGHGLFAFRDAEEAKGAVDALLTNPRANARAATELARAHFAHDVVLPPLLERATSAVATRRS
jgi:hypothetical protein